MLTWGEIKTLLSERKPAHLAIVGRAGKPAATDSGFRRVVALGFVSFFTDMSTEMILSILPLFIISVLGGTAELVGVIEGVGELANNALRVISGRVSDRVGRRKIFILAGYTLSTLAKPLFAITATVSQALFVRAIDRAGKGIRTPPRDVLISSYVPKEKAGTAFGLHRTLDQSGAIVGPLLAFFLIGVLQYRGLFLLSFAPALVALIILFIYVKEVRVEGLGGASLRRDARTLLQGNFLLLLLIIGIFSLGAFDFAFILLRATIANPIAPALVTLVYLIINLTHTIVGIPSGVLSDRIGKERVLLLGYVVFILTSLLGVILSDTYQSALLLGAIFGFYQGIIETVQRALIPNYAPTNLRGTAYSLYYLVAGTAALIANSIFGLLWQFYSPGTAFSYSIALSVVAALALLAFLRGGTRLA